MTWIRPELLFALRRWRDACLGVLVLAIGARWVFGLTGGLLHWFGFLIMFVGACLTFLGARRALLLQDGAGLGLVDVRERLITYMSPNGGGDLSIDGLSYVAIRVGGTPREIDQIAEIKPIWILRGQDGELQVPCDAKGSENLLDAMTCLPNIDISLAIKALSSSTPNTFVIWQKKP